MGWKLSIIGKDKGKQLDEPLHNEEVTTFQEAIEKLETLIPNTYPYDMVREVVVAKVR